MIAAALIPVSPNGQAGGPGALFVRAVHPSVKVKISAVTDHPSLDHHHRDHDSVAACLEERRYRLVLHRSVPVCQSGRQS